MVFRSFLFPDPLTTIYGTDETIGFDTALDTAVEAIDKIRDTAISHERVFIVEVMGREHGFLALSVGIASGAEFILVPEIKYDTASLCRDLKKEHHRGKTSIIIVSAILISWRKKLSKTLCWKCGSARWGIFSGAERRRAGRAFWRVNSARGR